MLVRAIEDRPDSQRGRTALDRIATIKAAMVVSEQRQFDHLASVADEPEKPRKILDVRKVKAKPEPKAKRQVLIDTVALAAVLAAPVDLSGDHGYGTCTLPATGRCHECDKPISGDRKFCGRCMSRRR